MKIMVGSTDGDKFALTKKNAKPEDDSEALTTQKLLSTLKLVYEHELAIVY